jgi:hypothetical protein
MAAISNRHHRLVIRRPPTGNVAFDGEFWSMQNKCGSGPFGLCFEKAAFRSHREGEGQS